MVIDEISIAEENTKIQVLPLLILFYFINIVYY